ncbi:MAG TPA: hypothetical protein VHO70_02720 [Chitinispirillaceae bacterium]|nr:hypothetical protein [Chitinispirillaceae bacterium]
MNDESVGKLVEMEIQKIPSEFADLKKFFIKPQKEHYETFGGNRISMWKVFEKDGYHIVYSDQRTIFGIAFNNIVNSLIYCGGNGTLNDAIVAFLEKDVSE